MPNELCPTAGQQGCPIGRRRCPRELSLRQWWGGRWGSAHPVRIAQPAWGEPGRPDSLPWRLNLRREENLARFPSNLQRVMERVSAHFRMYLNSESSGSSLAPQTPALFPVTPFPAVPMGFFPRHPRGWDDAPQARVRTAIPSEESAAPPPRTRNDRGEPDPSSAEGRMVGVRDELKLGRMHCSPSVGSQVRLSLRSHRTRSKIRPCSSCSDLGRFSVLLTSGTCPQESPVFLTCASRARGGATGPFRTLPRMVGVSSKTKGRYGKVVPERSYR